MTITPSRTVFPRRPKRACPIDDRSAGSSLHLLTLGAGRTRGVLRGAGLVLSCALGRTGVRARKREGDGASPRGSWELLEVRYRPDHVRRPRTGLRVKGIHPRDGWCDAAGDRNYNRPVRQPYPASAEDMWRQDGLYDVIVVTSHNQRPRVQGGGSAIFMHVARPGFEPTAGCIAFRRQDLLRLLERIDGRSRLTIGVRR